MCDADWRMSGDWEDDLCKRALVLVEELCFRSGGFRQSASCQEFSDMMRGPNGPINTGKSTAKLDSQISKNKHFVIIFMLL